ncbi:hypothetical protein [Atlantibacter hermannii]|uniref:hypothetical protein n=1 Tax=Atlantibacter hermannii TaxID=565 RepID=UPI0028A16833|nr:hypothetical protein [Atlantibacter hermannii]
MLETGTPWRQSHVLKHEDAVSLGLVRPEEENIKVVVVTHDCDLQSTSDAFVELIPGALKKSEKQFTRAKHPRRLDLCFDNPTEHGFDAIQLRHEDKFILEKERFTFQEPDDAFIVSAIEKQGLKQWLAAKYGRPAFPNVFEERLKLGSTKRKPFDKAIAQIVTNYSDHLIGVFFDLGENRFEDLAEGIPYELSIYLVYDAIDGGKAARENAEKACVELEDLFITVHGEPAESQTIALDSCNPVADTEFSLYELRRMDQWRVEYISLQDEFAGDFLGAAE